jgi:WD40 repeat protein
MLAIAGGTPGEYGEVRILRLSDGNVQTLASWEDCIVDVAFSRDGSILVAGGTDNTVRAYALADGRQIWSNRQHVDWVTAIDITDYEFAEDLTPNAETPGFFEFNEYELASQLHVQQHWQFPGGKYIVRKANWELEALDDRVLRLTRITIKGIGKTYEEKRQLMEGNFEREHADLIASLKSLHRDWAQKGNPTPFVITASRDRTVKVFGLKDGALFTTYKGHRREYGPLQGMHRVFGVVAEPGTRRIWSGGEGRHFHGWNPVTVRDEDGTAADMEERFSKEYSIDALRHDLPSPVFAMARLGNKLAAATADGRVQSFTIAGPDAVCDVQAVSPSQSYRGLDDQLFAIDAHAASNSLAAAGYRGEVAVWSLDSTEPRLRFIASPGH